MHIKFMIVPLLSSLAAVAFAEGKTMLFDFNDPANDSRVKISGAFSFVEGEGRNSSRALRWSREEVSKKPEAAFIRIPVEPGRRYGYEFWVKSGGVRDGSATAYFRAENEKGATVSSCEGRPHIRRQVGRKGWELVTCPSGRMPENARFARISVDIRPGVTGTLTFDDVKVVEMDRRLVEFVLTSTYRNTAVAGKVRFAAPYIFDPNACKSRDELRPEFVFVGADGSAFTVPAGDMDKRAFGIELDVARLAMGKHPVKAILKTASGKVLDSAQIEFTRAAEYPRRKVMFDEHRRLIVDGKPFFPIGMYVGNVEKLDFKAYQSAAFNCVNGSISRKALDLIQAHGLKAMVSMHYEAAALRERLSAFKDHPAILVWYCGDEPPPGYLWRQVELYRIMCEEDPDHPVCSVLDKPHHLGMFLPSYDVIGLDPYPIGNHRGGIDICSGWVIDGMADCYGLRPPAWQVPQAFNWGWFRPGPKLPEYTFPTREEFWSMAWQPIACGSNGLKWYSYEHLVRLLPKEEFASRWQYIKETVDTVAKYAPMMLSVEPAVAVTGGSREVLVRTWHYQGEDWILTVNTRREKKSVTLNVGGAFGEPKVEFGSACPAVNGSALTYELEPLAVSLVRLAPRP